MTTDVAIFVEDPGAANFVAELPAELARRGHRMRLFAHGPGARQLSTLQIAYEDLSCAADAAVMIATIEPKILLAGTTVDSTSIDIALSEAARAAGIKRVAALDSPVDPGHRFCGPTDQPLSFAPDYVLVPDRTTLAALTSVGFEDGRIVLCGHPHFDYVRRIRSDLETRNRVDRRGELLPGAKAGQKIVMFLTEISSGPNPSEYLRGPGYTLNGRGGSERRTDIVLETLLDGIATINPRPYVVLRLHPKNTQGEFADYFDEVDLVSDGGSPLPLTSVADLVVGMNTVLMIEAALLGLPTLSILPRENERSWLATVDAGITPCATDAPTAARLLEELLSTAEKGIDAAVDRQWPPGATQRAVDFLDGLIKAPGI